MLLIYLLLFCILIQPVPCKDILRPKLSKNAIQLRKKSVFSRFKHKFISRFASTGNDYFSRADLEESIYSQYILDVKGTILNDYSNERVCFTELLGSYSYSAPTINYTSYTDIVGYFNKYQKQLKIDCQTKKVFSFCQEAFVFVIDFEKSTIQTFQRQKYLDDKLRSDVSVIMPLSLNRMDRLPYLLSRWKGKVVIGLFCRSDSIEEAAKAIHLYSRYTRVKFVLYLKDVHSSKSTFYRGKKAVRFFTSIFPINFLRDLCIESITTTHFLYLDGDVFVSENLYPVLISSQSVLKNPSNVLLVILFLYNPERVSANCTVEGNCTQEWNSIPRNFPQLVKSFHKTIIPFDTPMHDSLKVNKWFQKTTIYPINLCKMCEPYAVIRRSTRNPIFHPYFINYGFNKVSLISRLIYDGYHFYVIPHVFGVDIPHPPTNMSNQFKYDMINHEMYELKVLVGESVAKRVRKSNFKCPDW